jgi:23S rRNA pseudouridine2605 synthase
MTSDQRIAKLLARAGVASRREVERMIAEGRIALNGVAIDTPATLLSSLDGITVDGQPVAAPEPTRLFLYHKPNGLLVTERDPKGRPAIYDRLPADLPRLVPVGRLDLNTEGLLLLTTDGGFKRQLELPATGVERTYRARAYGDITQAQLEELIHGVEIDGIRYGQIDANLDRRTGANVWIEMTLREGKNREVRRVLEHLGLQVSRLIRLRYGPFLLGDLPAGEIGEVKGYEIVEFRKTLEGGIPADAVRPAPRAGFRTPPTRTAPARARTERDGEVRRDAVPARSSRPSANQGDRAKPFAKRPPRADDRQDRSERPGRAAASPNARQGRFAPNERGGDRPTGRANSGERKPYGKRPTEGRMERGDRTERGASPSPRGPARPRSDGRNGDRPSGRPGGRPGGGGGSRPGRPRGDR